MARLDYRWFEEVVAPWSTVVAPDPDTRSASGVTANRRWTVTAQCSHGYERPDEYTTVFSAPDAGAPVVDASMLRAGQRPADITIVRDDRSNGDLSGDVVLGGALALILGLRSMRRSKVRPPRDFVEVDEYPEGVIPIGIVDRFALWPGDAGFGGQATRPPPSSVRARTRWEPIAAAFRVNSHQRAELWTNVWGDAAQFRHAVDLWVELVECLTAAGILVQRHPDSFRRPSTEEINAALVFSRDQLRGYKAERKAAKRSRRSR